MTSPAAQAVERETMELPLLDWQNDAEFVAWDLSYRRSTWERARLSSDSRVDMPEHWSTAGIRDRYRGWIARAESRTAEQGADVLPRYLFGLAGMKEDAAGPWTTYPLASIAIGNAVAAATRAAFLKAAQVCDEVAEESSGNHGTIQPDPTLRNRRLTARDCAERIRALTDALPAEAPEGREDRPDWQKQRREDESAYAEYSIPYGAQNTRQGIDIWRAALHWERARAASTEAAAVARGDMTMPEYVAAVNRSRQPAASEREAFKPLVDDCIFAARTPVESRHDTPRYEAAFKKLIDTVWRAALAQATPEGE